MDRTLSRSAWIAFLVLFLSAISFSQDGKSSRSVTEVSPSPAAEEEKNAKSAPSPSPDVQILYTGRLLGYFRVPSLQPRSLLHCPAPGNGDSQAAEKFLTEREANYKNAVLVGAGDNFSPNLEARMFAPPGPKFTKPYHPENKELYYGNGSNGWVFYNAKDFPDGLLSTLEQGRGTIPNDNVGCFLAAAGYAAVVPGRHDFYFGVDRVRQLARFMAGRSPSSYGGPPQMLGANLVVKTDPFDGGDPQPDKGKPTWLNTEWPSDYSVLNVAAEGSVYPWLSVIRMKVGIDAGSTGESRRLLKDVKDLFSRNHGSIKNNVLTDFLKPRVTQMGSDDPEKPRWEKLLSDQIYVCPSEGRPNQIEQPDQKCKRKLEPEKLRLVGNSIVYEFWLDEIIPGKNNHFSTLKPGKNYGLCLVQKNTSKEESNKKKLNQEEPDKNIFCHRFSVHRPFFYYPHEAPLDKDISDPYPYTDPEPFVFVPKKLHETPQKEQQQGNQQNGQAKESQQKQQRERPEVVIFGVVDPSLGEQVGVLNFAWVNTNNKFKTDLSVEDPEEALREQVDYFEQWYKKTKNDKTASFNGLKILLAQMSPQRARVLAARFPGFQVVVSATDTQQATNNTVSSITWSNKSKASEFVAVPSPNFDSEKKSPVVSLGLIEATKNSSGSSWTLASKPLEQIPTDEPRVSAANFRKQVRTVFKSCLPDNFTTQKDELSDFDRVKLLTLCAMQEHLRADVALIQKRDFFDYLIDEPADAEADGDNKANEKKETHVGSAQQQPDADGQEQEILERLIWKGDLLSLIYVRGSAIKKALAQSKRFDREDATVLSLRDQDARGLQYVGIRFDADKDEYLINELPINDDKIYTVATSDYIAAGDTGYPDLREAALNPRSHPAAFPDKLYPISSVVCRKLYPADRCAEPIDRQQYLDKLAMAPVPAFEQPSTGSKIRKLLPFHWPNHSSATTIGGAFDERVQRRPIWSFFVRNIGFGFTTLSNNISDKAVDARFGAISTSGVTAHENRSLSLGLATRLSRFSHSREYFVEFGVDYKEQYQGENAPLDQITNRFTLDPGITWRLRGGPFEYLAAVFSVHVETPFKQPVNIFGLSTKTTDPASGEAIQDQLPITRERNVAVLPRVGARWQNPENALEVGIQGGWDFDAFSGYRFDTGGIVTECLPSSSLSFVKCIENNSDPAVGRITKDSIASAILQTRRRAGLYWKSNFSLPFHRIVKYELENEGDFFMVNFHHDNVTDIRFRDLSKHRLKFFLWPSVSVGPALHLLLYQNKVNRDFLSQKQFMIETNISFNIFNRREKGVQLKNKP